MPRAAILPPNSLRIWCSGRRRYRASSSQSNSSIARRNSSKAMPCSRHKSPSFFPSFPSCGMPNRCRACEALGMAVSRFPNGVSGSSFIGLPAQPLSSPILPFSARLTFFPHTFAISGVVSFPAIFVIKSTVARPPLVHPRYRGREQACGWR